VNPLSSSPELEPRRVESSELILLSCFGTGLDAFQEDQNYKKVSRVPIVKVRCVF
jgi:hypothetical protein